ncbi:Rpn family recombination-promoting nuclease/putative transposase [Prevotella sp.]|uniref:Rpn family recombination-promoting nuclease/putative transposase n=1 Tax=Prevotella sp. TaxID=59823 RepID=UPI00307C788C
MRQSEERYISLLTDFGFKRIFGTDPNKELLVNFLNSLFDGEEVIKDVKYLNSENVGDVYTERKAIFDVYCENEKGEKFIVEMQNAYQTYFKDRSLFYSTFPIREQAPKGSDWNFCLKKVYVVALLNYRMSDEAFDSSDTIHTIALMDTKTNKVFNAKLMFKYVEVGRFDKTDDELISLSDKWMYVLKNLSRLDNRPSSLREKIFTKLFDAAAIARFTPMELREYEDSLKAYRDIKNSLDTAKEEGRAEGRAEGREEGRAEGIAMVVKNMHAKGMDIDVIASITGLNKDEVESLCL